MSRRWRVAGLAVVVLAAVAAWSLYLLAVRPRGHINPGRFERIKEGMTLAETEAVIGLRPGDYTVTRHPNWLQVYQGRMELSVKEGEVLKWKHWVSDVGAITVVFEWGRVVEKQFHDPKGWEKRDWVDTLRCLAPRQE